MTDIKSKSERSKNMAAIKSKGTKPEQYICHELFNLGYRYRKNVSYITGHPDLFFRKYNTALFVHGCFWHRHQGCRFAYTPKSRIEFWQKKFDNNVTRDAEVRTALKDDGIKCLIIWECTVKRMKKDDSFRDFVLSNIMDFLISDLLFAEF